MIRIDLQPGEAKYIRNLLGQCPHDQVNGLIVRFEQALAPPPPPPQPPPAAAASDLPLSGDETS